MHVLSVQVLNATRPSDFWLQVVAAEGTPEVSPHAVALFTAVQPVETFVNCTEYNEKVTLGADEYPALEDMLCSLVLLGNTADAEDGVELAEGPSNGQGEAGGALPRSGGGDVTELTDAALATHMHAWVSIISLIATVVGFVV